MKKKTETLQPIFLIDFKWEYIRKKIAEKSDILHCRFARKLNLFHLKFNIKRLKWMNASFIIFFMETVLNISY